MLLIVYIKYFKYIRCGNMICITGGLKTGKSWLGVAQSIQLLNSQRFKVCIVYNVIYRKGFYLLYALKTKGKIKQKKEKPMLYSNIPLNVEYIPITKDLLQRMERPIYNSVCYICECSLVADSMTYKDALLNEELLLFNKLWAHSSKGGYLIYDTQCISDNHYAVKRCLNSYFYIHHTIKIPLLPWGIMFLREERFSEDGNIQNNYEEDVEKTLMIHFVSKKYWKVYDRYCYSVLTDGKPKSNNIKAKNKKRNLKANEIVSFKTYLTIQGDKKQ